MRKKCEIRTLELAKCGISCNLNYFNQTFIDFGFEYFATKLKYDKALKKLILDENDLSLNKSSH